MADFVAVIRRAVDGLSENTPEMRVKVYERARGAVQRQLENMKPRPPEDMLRRQLDKLDAAIREVEREHSEALAPEDAVVAGAAVVAHQELAPEPEAVPAEPEATPTEPEVVRAETYAEPVEHPAAQAPAYEPESEPELEREPEVAQVDPGHPYEAEAPFVEHEVHPAEQQPDEEPAAPVVAPDWHQPVDEDVAEPWQAAETERKLEEDHEAWADQAAEPVAAHRDDLDEPAQEEWPQQTPATFKYAVDEDKARLSELLPDAAATVEGERFVEEVRAEPISADGAGQFGDVWPETIRTGEAAAKMPSAVEALSWDANAFDDLPPVPPRKATKPVPLDNYDDVDLFADVHGAPATLAPKDDTPGEGWRELKELAGYDTAANENGGDRPSIPPDLDQAMVQKLQGKNFRVEPKRKRFSLGKALIAVAALALVAGGGYLAWLNRGALNEMVTGLVTSAPKTATVADKPKLTEQQQSEAALTPTPSSAGPAVVQKPAENVTDVASAGGAESVVNDKFTQRLLANGSEVDDGPAAVPGQAVTEGKSVAEQNVAAAAGPAPAAAAAPVVSDAPAATTATPNGPSSVPPAPQPAATQQAAVIGAPEKMFLYEERLGQTSPTAIEGTVTWSVQEEKGENGLPQPTVQGNISVPERGLTAIITFKRNTDASLPASHLVELVFSVPPNFEGGAIDSVQRIAMKATEQDRGDALIAVPAKITDDFHMVALNDFPDARKTNLDLLKTRGWIDIPITYRNGRRALLTLSKGTTGTDAFNKVIGQWAALGDVSSSQ
ncbi:hypothetical protein [Rhizobium sp. RAF56]|uniref:hypothetical protein n=1 Tax=Rhizobium sp. RAF56 TaxID=3233062 RepID=UPI003F952A7D